MSGRLLAALALAAIGAAWTALAFASLPAASCPHLGDWDQTLAFFEIQHRAVTLHGELGRWNPWIVGGLPGAGHPQFDVVSPFFLPVLLLGSLRGAMGFFALHAFVGSSGAFLVARALGRSRGVALLTATIFLFLFTPIALHGVANRANGSLIPWIFLGWLEARRSARGVALLAVATALLMLEGGIYALVGAGLLVGLAAPFDGSPRVVLRGLVRFAGGVALGLLVAAARILPIVELYRRYPRESGHYARSALLDLDRLADLPAALAALLGAHRIGARRVLFDQPIFAGLDLGLPLLALLLFALVTGWRRPLPWLLLGLPLLLVLGNASPINLWAALTRLPVFSALNVSMSLLFVPFLPLSLLLADAARRLASGVFASPRAARVAFAAVALAGAAPLALQLRSLFEGKPTVPLPPRAGVEAPFVQTAGSPDLMLPSIRRNEGVLDAYEVVVTEGLAREAAERRRIPPRPKGSPDYLGEAWLAAMRRPLEFARFAPSRLELAWDGRAADRLLVNQNHFPGWRAELDGRPLEVVSDHGRIAVDLPAEPGTLVLEYAPPLAFGLAASAAGLLLLALLFTPRARRLLAVGTPGRLESRLGPT